MPHQINSKTIYLDHAAATPLSEAAGKAIEKYLYTPYGNPSSIHSSGRQAYDVLYACRQQIAELLMVNSTELYFTGSGTESDNLAILGLARAHNEYGKHVIVSAVEHKAVLAAAAILEQEGFLVTYVPVDEFGKVVVADLTQALRSDTILVSIMYANNEIGTIQPLSEIVRVCRQYAPQSMYPLIHTDACQAVGMLPVQPRELGVDAMTINSSKIYGPKGVGLLYVRSGVQILPLIVGGDQEHSRRAGTENIALIAGFTTALAEAIELTTVYTEAMNTLQTYFVEQLRVVVPGILFNGHPTDRLLHNVHVTIPEVEGESLVLMLSEAGVCCATGSACSSLDLQPSHVLRAIGQDDELIHGSLRFTFGRQTTEEELNYTARALGEIVIKLRKITACTTSAFITLTTKI